MEGRGREGKAYGEVSSFKKIGKGFGGFERHLSNFKVPLGDFGRLNIQIDNFVLLIIQNSNYNLQDKLQSISQCIDFKKKKNDKIVKLSHKPSISFPCWFH